MSGLIRNLLLMVAAFLIGMMAIRIIIERTTLENISAHKSQYDGRFVEFETYAQLGSYNDGTVWLGQPFEKKEVSAFVEPGTNLQDLPPALAMDLTNREYNRVRVLARGVIHDNCADLPCCFGESFNLSAAEITPIGPVERYRVPIH